MWVANPRQVRCEYLPDLPTAHLLLKAARSGSYQRAVCGAMVQAVEAGEMARRCPGCSEWLLRH